MPNSSALVADGMTSVLFTMIVRINRSIMLLPPICGALDPVESGPWFGSSGSSSNDGKAARQDSVTLRLRRSADDGCLMFQTWESPWTGRAQIAHGNEMFANAFNEFDKSLASM